MSKYFLRYLHTEDLITQQQLEMLLEQGDIEFKKNNLFFMYFYNMTMEQIHHTNDMLRQDPAKSFEDAAKELGYIERDKLGLLGLYEESQELIELKQAQSIIDAGMMDVEEVYDHLLSYELDSVLDDNVIHLPKENFIIPFTKEYQLILSERFNNSFGIKVTYSEMETIDCLQDELLIFQKLKGASGDRDLLIGLSSDSHTLQMMANDLYEIMMSGLDMPAFENTKEDVIDFFCELLNNTNGACTFKFDPSFDLDTPFYLENTMIEAPALYHIKLTINSYTINMCIVSDAYCFR